MDSLSTPVNVRKSAITINYGACVTSLGSCFAEHIGRKFAYYGFKSELNPFGISYNPLSIASSLDRLISKDLFVAEDLFQHQELWHSYAHHGDFSESDQLLMLEHVNDRLTTASTELMTSDILIITLGTAYAYFSNDTGEVVANCHKMPESSFTRRLLSMEEIVEELSSVLDRLNAMNPAMKTIITVSPVRHLRDGAVGNQVSKATLRLAVHELCSMREAIEYFPSYEIMLDELRDYRYYKRDMVHPNEIAIDHIWERFKHTYIDQEDYPIMEKVEAIRRAQQHRPRYSQSKSHLQFLRKNLENLGILHTKHGIDLSDAREYFTQNLASQ